MQTAALDAAISRTAMYTVERLAWLDVETSPARNLVTAGGTPKVATAIMMFVRLSTSVRRPNPSAPMIRATKTDSANPIAFITTMARREENDPPRMNRRTVAGRLISHGLWGSDRTPGDDRTLSTQDRHQTATQSRSATARKESTWTPVEEYHFP